MSTEITEANSNHWISIKNVAVGCYLCVLLVMALFPPLYLSVSGSRSLVLGIPLPIFYWLMIAALLGIGLWLVYLAECALGEIPHDEVQQ